MKTVKLLISGWLSVYLCKQDVIFKNIPIHLNREMVAIHMNPESRNAGTGTGMNWKGSSHVTIIVY